MVSGAPPLIDLPEVLGNFCQPLALQLSSMAGASSQPWHLLVKEKYFRFCFLPSPVCLIFVACLRRLGSSGVSVPCHSMALLSCQAINVHRSRCRCIFLAAVSPMTAVCCYKKCVLVLPLDAGEISSGCCAAAVVTLLWRCLTTATNTTISRAWCC